MDPLLTAASVVFPPGFAFNPNSIAPFLVGFGAAAVGFVALVREQGSRAGVEFFALTLSIAAWLLGESAVFAATRPETALWWARNLMGLGMSLQAALLFLFLAEASGAYRRFRPFIWTCLGLSLLFYAGFSRSAWLIPSVRRFPWGYFPQVTFGAAPFLGFVCLTLVLCGVVLARSYRAAPAGSRRTRALLLIAGVAISFTGFVDVAVACGARIYPIGFAGVAVAVAIAARVLGRFRFTEITAVTMDRDAMNAMTDGLLVIDLNGVIQVANGAAARILGRPASALRRVPVSEIDALAELARRLPGIIAGDPGDFEARLPTEAGRTVSFSASLSYNRDREPVSVVCVAHDLTERARAEAALRYERNLLRTLIDNLSVAVYVKDAAYRKVIANPRDVAWMRKAKPEGELIGKTDLEIFPPAMAASYLADDRAVVETGKPVIDREESFVDSEGRERWAITSKLPLFDEGGKVVGLVGTSREITEERLAAVALSRLNRELRALSSCNQTLMRATDEQTLLNDVCRIVCQEAGYRMAWVGYARNNETRDVEPVAWAGAEDGYLAGAHITWSESERGRGPAGLAIRSGNTVYVQDLQDASAGDGFSPWREAALARGYRSSIGLPLKDESSATFGVLNLYASERNAFTPDELKLLEELAGDLAFGITTLRIRTERERAADERSLLLAQVERERARAEARAAELDAIFASLTVGLIVYARDGTIVRTNETAKRKYAAAGIPTNIPLERRAEVLTFRKEDGRPFELDEQPVNRALRGETVRDVVQTTRDPRTGRDVWIAVSAGPLRDERGELVGAALTFVDMTERKRAEDELRLTEANRHHLELQLLQSQKLESLGRLASGVAHDFNNILGIIIGYSTLLEHGASASGSVSQGVEAIKNAGLRGAALVNQLLAFARKGESGLESLSLNAVIRELIKLLQETLPKTILLSAELDGELPAIRGDDTQVHQVLLNLCLNARDAMPEGGTITIVTKTADRAALAWEFPEVAAERYAFVTVRDTGVGMSPEVQSRIFEPFFTTKGPGKGTGLGLALVYSIVRNHGGLIAVDSAEGKGTAVRLYFPIEESAPGSLEAGGGEQLEIRGGTETILVIEDEEMLSRMLQAILAARGYHVLTASDGEEGVAEFARAREYIRVVLSDLELPRLSGEEVARRIRSIDAGAKVIISSGFVDAGTRARLIETGVFQIIPKPYLPAEVLRAIRSAIEAEPERRGGPRA